MSEGTMEAMTDADTLRESLLDLHDLDRHHVEIDAGDDCEDCVIVLEPLARLRAENERLEDFKRHANANYSALQAEDFETVREALNCLPDTVFGWEDKPGSTAALARIRAAWEQAQYPDAEGARALWENERDALRAEVERLRETLRETEAADLAIGQRWLQRAQAAEAALDDIERLDTDWTLAPDENLDRARFIARQALATHSDTEEGTP